MSVKPPAGSESTGGRYGIESESDSKSSVNYDGRWYALSQGAAWCKTPPAQDQFERRRRSDLVGNVEPWAASTPKLALPFSLATRRAEYGPEELA
jgi:hypothetical protein